MSNIVSYILYTGKPLVYQDYDETLDKAIIEVAAVENKYKKGIITLEQYFVDENGIKDEDSEVEIELTRDMIKKLYAEYCIEEFHK